MRYYIQVRNGFANENKLTRAVAETLRHNYDGYVMDGREDVKKVNDSIHIYERDGGIYITVSGTAVIRMDDNATCKEAADTLHSMRLAARDYIMGKKNKESNL